VVEIHTEKLTAEETTDTTNCRSIEETPKSQKAVMTQEMELPSTQLI